MTKLLATMQSVEALDYARGLILRLDRKGGDVGSPFAATESRHFFRDNILRMLLLTSDGCEYLTGLARAGESDAQELLRDTIREARRWHRELPVELEHYELLLLQSGGLSPPPASQQPKDDLTRNICIAMTVAAVCDRFGLKPMQSSARKRSGCAIVAEALGVIGMTCSYETARTIWKRYGRAVMPIIPGWTFVFEDQ